MFGTKIYTYHYCAQYQAAHGTMFIDGILATKTKITSMEDYHHTKKMIDPNNYHILTILSLEVLDS